RRWGDGGAAVGPADATPPSTSASVGVDGLRQSIPALSGLAPLPVRATMTAALSVRLLGPMQVDREGRPVVIGAAKLRVVLALLALRSGEVVSADALIDGLWPGVPPATAAKTLQGYISELRRLLQP